MYKGEERSPALVIFLIIITCSIYLWYWIYKVSQETQLYTGKQTLSPTAELLLCMFTCGIYMIYWFYKYGKMIAECQTKAGLQAEDNSIVYVILAIFGLSIINWGMMQSSLNKVWRV